MRGTAWEQMGRKKKTNNGPGIHQKLYEEAQFAGVFSDLFQTVSEGLHAAGGAHHCLLHGGNSPLLQSHTREIKLKKALQDCRNKMTSENYFKVRVSNKSAIDLRLHLQPTSVPTPAKPLFHRQEGTWGENPQALVN